MLPLLALLDDLVIALALFGIVRCLAESVTKGALFIASFVLSRMTKSRTGEIIVGGLDLMPGACVRSTVPAKAPVAIRAANKAPSPP